jgi:hypothetical protein
MSLTQAEKNEIRELAETTRLTLNGKRAKVAGWKLDYPFVVAYDGTECEYSYQGIKHVIENRNGHFYFGNN